MRHITWKILPDTIPALKRKCPKCGNETFEPGGRFRVNANGRRLDVFLIYRCTKCKATWNLSVYGRVRADAIGRTLYEKFLENDPALVRQYGYDPEFLKRNNAQIDLSTLGFTVEGSLPEPGETQITLEPAVPLGIPAQKAVAQKLCVSCGKLKRMATRGEIWSEQDILKAKLVKPFTFSLKIPPP